MPTTGATKAKEAEPEDISEDLFAAIPDVDDAADKRRAGPVHDARELVTRVRRDLEHAFQAEMDRLEKDFVGRVQAMQSRIETADAALARLAADRQRLLDEQAAHEKRLKAIRELADEPKS